MITFKNTVEYALKTVLEGLKYEDQKILDNVVVGYHEKANPDDLCHAIVDLKKPVTSTRLHNRRRVVLVDGEGEVVFVFKMAHPHGEDMNDYLPSLFFQALVDNPKLGGVINGDCNPLSCEGGLFRLEGREGSFYMSTVRFGLVKCVWIPPIEPEP